MPTSWRSIVTGVVLAAGVAVPVLLAVEANRGPACSRGCLLDFTNNYLEAMLAHDPSLVRVASNLKATENGKTLHLGDGIWKTAKGFPYRQAVADPITGQAGFFGVVTEDNGERSLFFLRLRVSGQRIRDVETLVARKGSHAFFSPETLTAPNPLFEQPVADADRAPREAMIAVANRFFDGMEQHQASDIPFGPDCYWWENGLQLTNTDARPMSCRGTIAAANFITKARGRRYPMVDEDRGLVLAAAELDAPAGPPASGNGPRSVLVYMLFQLDAGQIRNIQAFAWDAPLGASNGWD